jgi:hypothetical protein
MPQQPGGVLPAHAPCWERLCRPYGAHQECRRRSHAAAAGRGDAGPMARPPGGVSLPQVPSPPPSCQRWLDVARYRWPCAPELGHGAGELDDGHSREPAGVAPPCVCRLKKTRKVVPTRQWWGWIGAGGKNVHSYCLEKQKEIKILKSIENGECRAYIPSTHARKEEDRVLLDFPCNPIRTRDV